MLKLIRLAPTLEPLHAVMAMLNLKGDMMENKLLRDLGISLPIIQAPMILQNSIVPLAAAVSEAGGLGSIGCGEMSARELEVILEQMKSKTSRSFNANFFLNHSPKFSPNDDKCIRDMVAPYYSLSDLELPADPSEYELSQFDDEKLEVVLRYAPRMVSFHFGIPDPAWLSALREKKIVTVATATTVQEAIALEEAGVDAVVAQGWEAGGHRGSFEQLNDDRSTGTLALVPQIVDAVSVPVIASGGIADGRGIIASLALGASAAWMGTAFLTCEESPIADDHRNAILVSEDTDTMITRGFSGRQCRIRRTHLLEELDSISNLHDFPLMYHYTSPLKRHGIAMKDVESQFLLYGQAAPMNRELSVGKFLKELKKEMIASTKKLDF